MAEQKDYTDLKQGGDTGENVVDAIQPVDDGEGANQSVIRRPSENLRGRTEALRTDVQELLYYRDSGNLVIEGATGHSITWPGSTTASSTGIIAQTGALTVRPLLTPDVSTKGTLSVGVAATDQVIYTVASSAYASENLNAVTVEHRDTGAATLTVSISSAPVKRILVSFDSANTAHDAATAKLALDAAIGADSELAGNLVITDNGAASDTIAAITETRIEGTADQEAHVIPSGLLTTFTTAEPLAEGDAIGIWYRYVVEPVGGDPTDPKGGLAGGRRESNPDRATSTIPLASLFVTSTDPHKIPGAVPLCKVVNNELVWVDGSRFTSGATGPIGTSANVSVDASGFQGSATLLINGGLPSTPSATSAQALFAATDTRLGQLRAVTYVCTDGTASTGGDFNGATAVQDAISAAGGTGATLLIRRGTYTPPASWNTGNNVTLLGEDEALVTLDHSAGTSLALGSDVHLKNLTLDTTATSGARAAAGSDDGSIKNVTITQGLLSIEGNHWALSDVTMNSTTLASATQCNISGNYGCVRNLHCTGKVNIGGANNTVDGVHVATNAVYNQALLQIVGSYNTVRNVHTEPHTVNTSNSTATVVGAFHTLENVRLDEVGGTTVAGHRLLEIDGCQGCKFTSINASTDNGHALQVGDASGPNVATVFENCLFSNNSANASDFVLGTGTGDENDHEVTWNNCLFDQNEQTAHSMLALGFDATSKQRWAFNHCAFTAAAFGVEAAVATDTVFTDCVFRLKNPVDGGLSVRLLAGTNDAFSGQHWEFGSSTAGTGCILNDCTFDFFDSEVKIGTDPAFTSVGYLVYLADQSVARNTKVINVNKHASTVSGSLVAVNTDSELDGLDIVFTATAAAQTGTASIGNLCAITGARSRIANWRHLVHPHSKKYIALSSVDDVIIEDCALLGSHEITVNPTTAANNLVVRNNVFGSSSGGLTSTMVIPPGVRVQYLNNLIYSSITAGSPITWDSASAHSDPSFTNNVFIWLPAVTNTIAVHAVASASVNNLRLNGNTFDTTASAGGARELFSTGATFASVIAAGNHFANAGGTTASTNVVPSSPNSGF